MGTYIYKHHLGKRTLSLIQNLFTSLGISLMTALIFMIYTGGEMSLEYRSFTDHQAKTGAMIALVSVFTVLFLVLMFIPVKNTIRQISYFYVDKNTFIHYYDGDQRTFDYNVIGAVQVNKNHIVLYDHQQIEMYIAKFDGNPSEMYSALSSYNFPLSN
ncbi:hypothetical protein ACMGE6_02330 [Macrococcus equi]|uniref:hypothetical protein n=1 Tax=Macrococcus equi TaxID=3395462 RepID=UPI0039BEB15C